jgi:hypothetical protein
MPLWLCEHRSRRMLAIALFIFALDEYSLQRTLVIARFIPLLYEY